MTFAFCQYSGISPRHHDQGIVIAGKGSSGQGNSGKFRGGQGREGKVQGRGGQTGQARPRQEREVEGRVLKSFLNLSETESAKYFSLIKDILQLVQREKEPWDIF